MILAVNMHWIPIPVTGSRRSVTSSGYQQPIQLHSMTNTKISTCPCYNDDIQPAHSLCILGILCRFCLCQKRGFSLSSRKFSVPDSQSAIVLATFSGSFLAPRILHSHTMQTRQLLASRSSIALESFA